VDLVLHLHPTDTIVLASHCEKIKLEVVLGSGGAFSSQTNSNVFSKIKI
jgi:hypothetical protein